MLMLFGRFGGVCRCSCDDRRRCCQLSVLLLSIAYFKSYKLPVGSGGTMASAWSLAVLEI